MGIAAAIGLGEGFAVQCTCLEVARGVDTGRALGPCISRSGRPRLNTGGKLIQLLYHPYQATATQAALAQRPTRT